MSSIQNLSLYIPHIFANFNKEDIVDVFENQQYIGKVKSIDLIPKISKNNTNYNAAYVHFDLWYDTKATRNLQERILDDTKEARIVYEDPWYWIVLENKTKKYEPHERKLRIQLDAPSISTNNVAFETPTKEYTTPDVSFVDATKAPVKGKTYKQVVNDIQPINLEKKFDMVEEDVLDSQLEEFEQLMEEEEKHLIYIDSRYVQSIEGENAILRMELYNLKAAYMALNNMYFNECNKKEEVVESV
jgi:hypothetical protein